MIKINRELCNGCGACVNACAEGALALVDGKAKLVREDYCDGLGACLPVCPTGAISFGEEERKPSGPNNDISLIRNTEFMPFPDGAVSGGDLSNWPIQIKLTPAVSPRYNEADLLIAADCTAFACGDFHEKYIRNRVTLIGCPKLDSCDYSKKLTEILAHNDVRSVTLVRMEVPCCGGMAYAAKKALEGSGKNLPLRTIVISRNGTVVKEETVN
ncbi:MAG: ATP-binding protein [Candidatus Methanomethylophilaceae archaeon]|jgi:ferredoxin